MATLDPALMNLTETLGASGLDWLAGEVLAGVLAGHVLLEDEATLAVAQSAARRAEQHDYHGESSGGADTPPLGRDEQIYWAAEFVLTRIKGVVAMMAASIERIDRIESEVDGPAGSAPRAVVVSDDEAVGETSAADVDAAAAALPALAKAIIDWRDEALGTPP